MAVSMAAGYPKDGLLKAQLHQYTIQDFPLHLSGGIRDSLNYGSNRESFSVIYICGKDEHCWRVGQRFECCKHAAYYIAADFKARQLQARHTFSTSGQLQA